MALATIVANKGKLNDFATKSTVTLIRETVLVKINMVTVRVGMVMTGANIVTLCWKWTTQLLKAMHSS